MRKSNIKTPLAFKAALVVMCAVLVSFHLTGGLYARYSTVASGSDSARVAKISMAVDPGFSGYTIPDGTITDKGLTYSMIESFTVTNDGEVAYKYSLNLVLSQDISLDGDGNEVNYNNPKPYDIYTATVPFDTAVKNISIVEDAVSITDTTIKALTGLKSAAGNPAYYAFSTDNKNYAWSTSIPDANGYFTVCEDVELQPGETHYYKVMYFMVATDGVLDGFKQMTFFYEATCEQID